jgi:hypothetical protein
MPISRLYFGSREKGLDRYFSRPEALSDSEIDKIFSSNIIDLWTSFYRSVLIKVRSIHEKGLSSILQSVLVSEFTQQSEMLDVEDAFRRVKSFMNRERKDLDIGSLKQFQKKYTSDIQLWKLR